MIMTKIRKNCQKSQFRYLEKGVLELCRAATLKPRKRERYGFLYWPTTDKLEFTDWSKVSRMFGCGEIVILEPLKYSQFL